jgi:hypothetical protein
MEVLGREIPAALAELHDDVVALRPEASLVFKKGYPPGGGKSWHRGDVGGDSEIVLAEDFEDFDVAHSLLHAYLYRQGCPLAEGLPGFERDGGRAARLVSCCVTHPTLHQLAAKRELPDEIWKKAVVDRAQIHPDDEGESSLLGLTEALHLADAAANFEAEVAAVVEECRDRFPERWKAVQEMMATMERTRQISGMRLRRSMIDLLRYFDGYLEGDFQPATPLLRSVSVTLVLAEHQLGRPAERLVELVMAGTSVVAFVHKQDHGVFFNRVVGRGPKRELAEMKDELKKSRLSAFLETYWVPYVVDMGAAG